MTEQDWMIGTNPTPMLEFVRGKANDRKLRLFAVACCQLAWHRMIDKCSRRAVEVAERYADGLATPQTLLKWHWAAYEAYELIDDEEDEGARYREAAFVANCATHHDAAFAAVNAAANASAATVPRQDTLSDSSVSSAIRPMWRTGDGRPSSWPRRLHTASPCWITGSPA